MLASTPPRNSRPELIVDDGQGMFFPACPIPWHRPDREAEPGPGVKDVMTHRTERFRMPLKTHSEGALVFHVVTCCGDGGDTEVEVSERSNSIGGR
jgi:hypothetical protein